MVLFSDSTSSYTSTCHDYKHRVKSFRWVNRCFLQKSVQPIGVDCSDCHTRNSSDASPSRLHFYCPTPPLQPPLQINFWSDPFESQFVQIKVSHILLLSYLTFWRVGSLTFQVSVTRKLWEYFYKKCICDSIVIKTRRAGITNVRLQDAKACIYEPISKYSNHVQSLDLCDKDPDQTCTRP